MELNHEVDYELIRSKRRTVAIEVKPDSSIVVKAPMFADLEKIKKAVQSKFQWIMKKKKQVSLKAGEQKKKLFCTGEEYPYLGKKYPLAIIEYGQTPLALTNRFELLNTESQKARHFFVSWYKQKAKDVFQSKVSGLARKLNVKHGKVKISNADTRWGSCGQGLNFSWKLVMAPEEIVDYVVAHEVCHIAHKDHSDRFWKSVETICPDYKSSRKWLKTNGHLLEI